MMKWLCGLVLFLSPLADALVLTEKDAQKTVVVPVGEVIILRLHENPTTGYLWRFELSNLDILQKQDGYFLPPEKTLVGAGGIREQSFVPYQTGDVILRATYQRPWETKGIHTLAYPIIVR